MLRKNMNPRIVLIRLSAAWPPSISARTLGVRALITWMLLLLEAASSVFYLDHLNIGCYYIVMLGVGTGAGGASLLMLLPCDLLYHYQSTCM